MADFNEVQKKVALSLTHVEYTKGDVIGFVLAWSSLFPIFLVVAFLTLTVIRRDLYTVIFLLGILLNESINLLLKHIIRQPRPESDLYSSDLFVEYGMPSSHAQFMTFFATFFTLFIFIRVVSSQEMKDYLFKGVCAAGAMFGSLLCCFSRIYLGYHTVSQILYGMVIGCILACIWFTIVEIFLAPHFPRIYFWKISELLFLKDVSLIPNYLWYEFTAARHETINRLKRKSM